jgi:UDP-2,3-diacylglucosamine pyrophosphatase LpxH
MEIGALGACRTVLTKIGAQVKLLSHNPAKTKRKILLSSTQRTSHTLVVSDLHLTESEIGIPGRTLWKRYKRRKYFIDQSFAQLLAKFQTESEGPFELVLNGDIFDFDAVMRIPESSDFEISWLERLRGLTSEEEKSRFKMKVILEDHPVWIESISQFIRAGNSVVFIIGNHDIELHWPSVQADLLDSLKLDESERERVRVCEWFYISQQDTFIEHSNQYDDFCTAIHPIHPFVKSGKKVRVRLPFGNITARYMANGLGLFNPHAESSYLMSFGEYLKFFYRYALRIQPGLPFTYAWSAFIAFFAAIKDGFLPAMRDPLYTETRVMSIAEKANATPIIVRTLRELHAHPAIYNPIKVIQELWLDRILLTVGFAAVTLWLYAMLNLVVSVSVYWWWTSLFLTVPALFYYSRGMEANVRASQAEALKQAPLIAKVSGMNRIVFGHTHIAGVKWVDQVEVFNPGTWSPAFKDPECREAFGQKCVVWIKKDGTASLFLWDEPDLIPWSENVPQKR